MALKEVFLVLIETIYLFQGTTIQRKLKSYMKLLKTYFSFIFHVEQLNVISYQQLQWMARLIKDKINKQSKLTKIYFKNDKT